MHAPQQHEATMKPTWVCPSSRRVGNRRRRAIERPAAAWGRGGGTACNGEPAALVIPAAEARARSRQAGRARALWARAHRLWVGTGCLQPRLWLSVGRSIYTIGLNPKNCGGSRACGFSPNEHPRMRLCQVDVNIKSMFDGLMQNGRGPSCRSSALPLLRLGPRSTDAASRLPTSSVRSGRRRARQRRPHRQEAPACAAHRGAI